MLLKASNECYPSQSPELTLQPSLEAAPRTSQIVANLARNASGDTIEVGTIVNALRDRSFGVLMILFAMPNAVIPGISWILGAPIVIVAMQLLLGRRKPWLPQFMLRRKLKLETFQAVAERTERFLVWIEQWLKPRFAWLTSRTAERLLGIYLALVAIVLMAPIPFGNALPALSISFIAAGLIEKDGLAILLGLVLGVAGTILVAALMGGAIALIAAALALFGW